MTGFLMITGFFGWHLQHLSFDFEFEKFFPKNDPESLRYENHRKQFGYDNDFLLLILSNETGIFEPSFLASAAYFERELSAIDDVETVISPLSQKHLVNGPTGLLAFPLLNPVSKERLSKDSVRIFSHALYASAFSDDGKSMGIYITHTHFQDQESSQLFVEEILEKAANSNLASNIRLVGKLTAQNVFIDFIQKDFGKYLLGSLALSFLLLLFLFRSLQSSILPFLISLFSIIWLFGLMAATGTQINLLSSLLPPILFFVSMSDAIHLMNAIQKSKSEGRERLRQAVDIVWTPTLLTSVTTAIGFLSLLWINTAPIQILGIFAAIGILFAFIITFTFGLMLSTWYQPKQNIRLIQIPDTFLNFLLNHKQKTLAALIIIISALIPGIYGLKVNAFLLDDLPKESQVRKDFEYTDQFLGGSKPYEIRIEAKGEFTIWDQRVMNEVVKIERYLSEEYPVGRIQAPSTVIKYLHQANVGGLNENYRYPENEKDYQKARILLRRLGPGSTDRIVTSDNKVARIVGFIPELGSYETNIRNEKLLKYLNQTIDRSKIDYEITGTTYLIDKSHELLSFNLIKGLLTAVLTIGIVLGIYFRSFRLLIISLVPNLIPLLMVAGILGWMDISLKMTTSIIFTIAFGIAVDDTIHMMSYYLKQKQQTNEVALRSTFFHAGSAMLITSIIVIAGFSLFLLSDFGATFYLGLFVCLSLLIALIIDLTLLPLLLLSMHAKNRRSNT